MAAVTCCENVVQQQRWLPLSWHWAGEPTSQQQDNDHKLKHQDRDGSTVSEWPSSSLTYDLWSDLHTNPSNLKEPEQLCLEELAKILLTECGKLTEMLLKWLAAIFSLHKIHYWLHRGEEDVLKSFLLFCPVCLQSTHSQTCMCLQSSLEWHQTKHLTTHS